ncbi:hypothetical protein ACTU3I_03885 [Microbacterium sp. RD1]|uniref:hypothetical protein n=1 Tax=Microbacterium sp. RD1 TaxID=3457313 RepID=UPI003FA58D7C
MKPWIAWMTGVALVAAAWLVALLTPGEDAALAPFAVTASLDEQVVSRTLTATVSNPRIAERVAAGGWSADGTWLVVDAELEATREEDRSRVGAATLQIGERFFEASERPQSIYGEGLAVGIPQSGSLAFELPSDAMDEPAAVLRLATNSDTRLDELIEMPLDLGDLPRVGETELADTDWSRG